MALRTLAVKKGLDGANLIELFEFFLESGYEEEEAYLSAVRIFRGGDPRGSVVNTKCVSYLAGLILTSLFFQAAIVERKERYLRSLFCGRLVLGDVIKLDEYMQSGFIAQAIYLPPWVEDHERLCALLCYANMLTRLNVDDISMDDFRESA